jgi:glyoxylase-like metal-dependent hydrolase (beta-lactamase superfamily II)
MREYTIHPLVVGANQLDQGNMTYLHGYGQSIYIPIIVFYIKGGDKNILVDTGLESFVLPPEVTSKLCERYGGIEILEFEQALAKVGLEPQDINIIIHTHLHNDHCENDKKCKNAKIYIQKAEYEAINNPHPMERRFFPELLEGCNISTIEGDQEIMDGIKVLFTPGHTPGTQSVLVNTAKGKAIIVGWCCNERNFPKTAPPIPPGVHISNVGFMDSYEIAKKIKEMADILIPLHGWSVAQMKTIP